MRRNINALAILVFILTSLALFVAAFQIGVVDSQVDGSRVDTGNGMIRFLRVAGTALGLLTYEVIETTFAWLGLNTSYEFLFKKPIHIGLICFPFFAAGSTWALLTLLTSGVHRLLRKPDNSRKKNANNPKTASDDAPPEN